MKHYLILFLLLLGFGRCSIAQKTHAPGDSLIDGKLLQADVEFLRDKILETHQSPFTHLSEAEFDSLYERLHFFAGQGMHYYAFCRELSLWMKSMKDSHSFVDYKGLVNYYAESGGRFAAFTVHSINDQLYIANDELKLLPEGAELISIAGIPEEQAREYVEGFAVIEGNSVRGSQRIRDAVFPVVFPSSVAFEDSISVSYKMGNDTIAQKYPSLSRKELREYRKNNRETKYLSRFQKKHGSVYELKYEGDLAVLKIGSFSYGSQGVYNRFLYKSFKDISRKGVQHLAVDLRDNTGGHSGRAEYLMGFLKPGEVVMPANIIARQSALAEKRQKQAVNGFQRFMLKLVYGKNEEVKNFLHMVELDSGVVDTVYYSDAENVKKFDFKGKSYLWINGRSASASVVAASNFRRHDIGQIMGESCLGPMTGTWGNPVTFALPNTGVKVNLSTIRFNADNSFIIPQEPIHPDIEVEYSSEDLMNDHDPYLERTLELSKAGSE